MPLPLGTVPFTPPDLPNPQVRKVPSQPWDDELRQLAIKEPTRQTDWPNPAPRKPHAWIHTFAGSLLALGLLVSVPPAPFAQTVQANPVVRKANVQTDQVSVNTRLLSAAPVVQEDWPNPRVRPPPAPPDVVQNNLLNQKSAWPFHNENQPNPVLRKPPTPTWEDSLRQLTIPAPFYQTDWITPPPKRYAQPDVVQNNTLRQVPPPIAGFPFRQVDQPNPVPKKSPSQPWEDSLRQLTIPAPFAQEDWQNPVVRRFPQPDVVQNTAVRRVPPPPFRQLDWQNPTPKKSPSQPWDDELRQLTIPAPFYQKDWPNPVVRPAARQELVENNALYQVPPPIAGFPFQQINWPNPVLKKPPTPTWDDELRQLTIPAPFYQTGWQNPVVRRAAQQDAVQNTTVRQAPPPVAGFPFQQTNWPNPVPKKAPSQPWEDGLRQLNLSAPFRQTDWVTPPAKRHPQPDVVQNTLLRLVAPPVVVLPFQLSDWSNPIRRVSAGQEFVQNTLLYKPIAGVPFRQLDWQNPALRRVAQQPDPYQRAITQILVPVTGVTGSGTIGTVTVSIANLWNPVDDSQGSTWSPVPDSQTSNWTPVIDSQSSSWSPVTDSQTSVWTSVDDTQASTWTPINDSQTSVWGNVTDTQTPNWTPVNDAQTPAWSAVADTQVVVWTNVNDTQANTWTPVDDSQTDDWTPVP